MMSARAGVVGLGQMGSAMARRLVRQGEPLWVFNRSAGAVAELEALGAHAALEELSSIHTGRVRPCPR